MGIKKPSEGGTQTERDSRAGFRVEVVGSNPAGPTTSRTGPIKFRAVSHFTLCWFAPNFDSGRLRRIDDGDADPDPRPSSVQNLAHQLGLRHPYGTTISDKFLPFVKRYFFVSVSFIRGSWYPRGGGTCN